METNDLLYLTENAHELRPEDRVVGAYLFDKFNEMIARVQGLLVEKDGYRVRYAVFKEGGFLFTEGKIILLPREHFEMLDMGKVRANWSRESLQHAPTIESLETLSRNEENIILSYFDLLPYWDVPPLPGAENPETGDAENETEES